MLFENKVGKIISLFTFWSSIQWFIYFYLPVRRVNNRIFFNTKFIDPFPAN